MTDADGRQALRLRLAAPPVDGAANKALIAYLSAALEIPKSDIAVQFGQTARLKRLLLSGDGPAIMIRLTELAGEIAKQDSLAQS